MRTLLLACAAALLSSAAFAAGRAATIYTADGQKLVGTVLDESFAVKTAYGTVTVPVAEVRAIWPGFQTDEKTRKRIAALVPDLAGPGAGKAAQELTQIGRAAVPALKEASVWPEEKLAKVASALLEKLWPGGAEVPGDDRDALFAKGGDFRGSFAFSEVRIEGPLGKAAVPASQLRLIAFAAGEAPRVGNAPAFAAVKGADAEIELALADGGMLRGQLDAAALEFDTGCGKLSVPVRELVSVKPGHPCEVVARGLTFQGELAAGAFNLRTKLGAVRVEPEKVLSLKVVLDEADAGVPDLFETRLGEWKEIFNGSSLKGWKPRFAPKLPALETDKTIRFRLDAMNYDEGPALRNVAVKARVNLMAASMRGGLAIVVRSSGDYYSGYKVVFAYESSVSRLGKGSDYSLLKQFRFHIRTGEWQTYEVGIVGNVLRASVEGKVVAEVKIDDAGALPAGKVAVGADGYDAEVAIGNVRIKALP